MTPKEFESFVQSATFKGEPMEDQVEETHISWITFTKNFVFKIKKPVQLSFLDFSDLEKRKMFCERELRLNQRFSKIYLDVLPVTKSDIQWHLGEGQGEVVDYAVQMRRMASSKRMDKMLEAGKVDKGSMQALAKEVASFHRKAEIISTPFDSHKAKGIFNDILEVGDFIGEELGKGKQAFVHRSVTWSNGFLDIHAQLFQDRIEKGLKRDLHGDLHAGNIFLYKNPILFDCIEFSDEFRQIDLLYEIAFLCMELEAKGYKGYSEQFLSEYLKIIPCIETDEDAGIFLYFKCLRANVRAKVRALGIRDSASGEGKEEDLEEINHYLSLMEGYLQQMDA
jgi:aminoglycoside phosphotransferase family enzyme